MTQPALDIARSVSTRQSTSAEHVAAALERAEASTPLNIFTLIDDENARRKAAAVDADPANTGPLAGVPFAVKDLIDQAGLPNTCGASFAPFVPAADAICVARMEAAGAVPVGRVGLHEFAFGFSSENPWFGPVRNPLDPTLSTGGSSGGSAAAVAAGIVPLALGTDTGGSVRVPAALCGIVGLKVTHGRGSIRGVYPLAQGLDTVGPLGRTVADVAAAFAILAPHDPDDPVSIDRAVGKPGPIPALQGLRLAVPHPWVDTGYEPRIEAEFADLIQRLSSAGVTVEHRKISKANPPGLGLASAYYEVVPVHRARFTADPEAYGPDLQTRLRDAMAVTDDQYAAALEWRREVRSALEGTLDSGIDAILTPTTAAVTKPIGQEMLQLTTGESHYRGALSHFTALVNNAGLPALALPVLGTGVPPLSMQLVGPMWSEWRLLSIGLALEAAGIVGSGNGRESTAGE